MIKHEVNFRCV